MHHVPLGEAAEPSQQLYTTKRDVDSWASAYTAGCRSPGPYSCVGTHVHMHTNHTNTLYPDTVTHSQLIAPQSADVPSHEFVSYCLFLPLILQAEQ